MKSDPRIIFGLVALSLLVTSMQFAMISIAVPDVITDLHTSLRWVNWVITGFTLAQAVSMPIIGRLSDSHGRRTIFIGGLLLFALSSLACALAPNIYFLIGARLFQGLSGGSLMPSAYGIIGDRFEGPGRSQAIGLISAVFPIGSVIGPILGGIIVDNAGWRWTFAINVPTALLVVALGLFLLPKSKPEKTDKIDYVGAGLLVLGVTSIVYALTELAQRSGESNLMIVAIGFVLGAIGLLLFVKRESSINFPVLELKLLKRREFALVNGLNFCYGVSVFGMFAYIPLYAERAYHMSSSEAGFMITPRAIAMIFISAAASLLLPRTGYRKPIIAGLIVVTCGLFILSMGLDRPEVLGVRLSNFTFMAGMTALLGTGLGLAGPAANNAAIELAPDNIAAITGLRGMFRFLGGVLGTTAMTLVTSRAASTEQGLELSFLGLAVVTALTTLIVLGIPDKVGYSREVVFTEAEPSPATP
jgi:EmrB/QacA subfamily drug resistance transporter